MILTDLTAWSICKDRLLDWKRRNQRIFWKLLQPEASGERSQENKILFMELG